MSGEYELSNQTVGGEQYIAIARVGKPDAIEEMLDNPALHEGLYMSLQAAAKVRSGGLKYGERARIITPITRELYLFELKNRATAWRVLAYMHPMGSTKVEPVFLMHTKGHRGKTGRLPNEVVKKGEKLAIFARELMEEEFGNEKEREG